MIHELPENYKIALKAALEASEEIMRMYKSEHHAELKADGSPVTAADFASSTIITKHLEQTGIPIIGEESIHADYSIRKEWSKVWIVDPLDGTKEYIKKNGEFAVNIALIKNRIPIMGIITSPVNKTIIFGGKSIGAYHFHFEEIEQPQLWQQLSDSPLNNPLVIATSRSHPSSVEQQLLQQLEDKYSKLAYLRKGSSLKFFDLVLGNADIYPRFAPTMEWDIAAGQAILEGLGGKVVDVDTGDDLTYNKEDLYNPHFIAKTKALLEDNE